jgi:hypothetical protein
MSETDTITSPTKRLRPPPPSCPHISLLPSPTVTSPSPPSLPTSSLPTLSHPMSRGLHRLPLRRPWRLAGFCASSVETRTRRLSSRSLVSRAGRWRAQPRHCVAVRLLRGPSFASLWSAYTALRTTVGPRFTRGTLDGCGHITSVFGFLADSRWWVVVSPGGAALPECCSIRETRSSSKTRSGRTSLHLLLRGHR